MVFGVQVVGAAFERLYFQTAVFSARNNPSVKVVFPLPDEAAPMRN